MIHHVLFISTPELFLVGLVVLLVFGSDKLPEIARGLGKAIKTVRNATDDIKHEITKTATDDFSSKEVEHFKKQIEEVKDKIEETGSIKRRL